MTEKYVHRTCPCYGWDVEGIQTWLEDMAAKGLHVEPDGALFGIFSFLKGEPKAVRYRLTPVKEKKGFFDDNDAPDLEEQEYSESCGWEYVLRHGSFYIYRATDPKARPLHTDPKVHALALKALEKQRRSFLLSEILFWAIWLGLRGSSALSVFRSAVVIGPMFVLSIAGLLVWALGGLLNFSIRLGKCRKRLLNGDLLENRKEWQRNAWKVRLSRLIPWVLAVLMLVGAGRSWKLSYDRNPVEVFPHPMFPTVSTLFPGEEVNRLNMGDYNTYVQYENPLATNIEWNESATVGDTHCILRITWHVVDPKCSWLAKGLADDYYRYERFRYNGKRFEDLEVPETELDSVRVFSSYGITHVLIRHSHIVIDAVVSISEKGQGNNWQLWLEQMEKILR